jgi:hypothetical protein
MYHHGRCSSSRENTLQNISKQLSFIIKQIQGPLLFFLSFLLGQRNTFIYKNCVHKLFNSNEVPLGSQTNFSQMQSLS